MSQESESSDVDRLAASKNDPDLTVHRLSEFVFCPRAGLCLYEQDEDFHEEEADEVNLSYLPIHEKEELIRTYKALIRQLIGIGVSGAVLTAILCGMAWLSGWPWGWLAPTLVAVVTLWAIGNRIYWIFQAVGFLEILEETEPELPDPDSTAIQKIHWCALLSSEVMLSKPQSSFRHDQWKFGGKPWRLIEYGDFVIPVFRPRKEWKGVFDQHLVRMAAYCRLIELETGRRSPYGVIAENDNYQAWVLPNTPRSQALFERALPRARSVVCDSEELNHWPPILGSGAGCKDCPRGRSLRVRRGESFLRHKEELSWFVPDGIKYHSHCSDRFREIPPNSPLGRQLERTQSTSR
jgi:hypothetical protein